MNPALAAALTRALFCGAWPREGRVCVYVSYSDETQVANGNGQFITAGVVGNELYWPNFSERWAREVLNSEPKIPYLHMVDLRSKEWRAQYGLTWADQLMKVRQAVKIMREERAVGFFCGTMYEPHYKSFVQSFADEGIKIRKRDTVSDFPCFTAYFLPVLLQVRYDVPDLQKISFALSEKAYVSQKIQTRTREVILQVMREQSPPLDKYVGAIYPLPMEQHPPLQAADVLCWHLNRVSAGLLEQSQEDVCNMKALQEKPIVGADLSGELIEKMGTNLLAQMKGERVENEQGIQSVRPNDAATSERSAFGGQSETGRGESDKEAEES